MLLIFWLSDSFSLFSVFIPTKSFRWFLVDNDGNGAATRDSNPIEQLSG